MFEAIAMFFTTIKSIFSSINRIATAGDYLAATAEDRAKAFRSEQAEENKQRLAKLEALVAHNDANPTEFEF